MNWLVENWSLLVIIVAVGTYFIINGKKSVMNWLLYAVTMAERDFCSGGMGWIKLQSVYDSFVASYPILSKIIPFTVFSAWVDVALEEMRSVLKSNKSIKDFVNELKEGEES